jgi:hypothetical protein
MDNSTRALANVIFKSRQTIPKSTRVYHVSYLTATMSPKARQMAENDGARSRI